jgi:lipid-A-disaccharide synthase
MADFGAALEALRQSVGPFTAVLPTLPHVEGDVRALAARWPEPPKIVFGEDAKYAAFRAARAGLAASGTVTLELALAGVPMVGAYKVSLVEEQLKYLIKVPSILLPNLILGERAIPEFLQRDCTPAALGAALARRCSRRPGARCAARRPVSPRSADGAPGRRSAQRSRRARGHRDDRGANEHVDAVADRGRARMLG